MSNLRKSNSSPGKNTSPELEKTGIFEIINSYNPRIRCHGGGKINIRSITVEKRKHKIYISTGKLETYKILLYCESNYIRGELSKTTKRKRKNSFTSIRSSVRNILNKRKSQAPVSQLKYSSRRGRSLDYRRLSNVESRYDSSMILNQNELPPIYIWNSFLMTIKYYLIIIEKFEERYKNGSILKINYIPKFGENHRSAKDFIIGELSSERFLWENIIKINITSKLSLSNVKRIKKSTSQREKISGLTPLCTVTIDTDDSEFLTRPPDSDTDLTSSLLSTDSRGILSTSRSSLKSTHTKRKSPRQDLNKSKQENPILGPIPTKDLEDNHIITLTKSTGEEGSIETPSYFPDKTVVSIKNSLHIDTDTDSSDESSEDIGSDLEDLIKMGFHIRSPKLKEKLSKYRQRSQCNQ